MTKRASIYIAYGFFSINTSHVYGPIVNIVSIDKMKISDEIGENISTITFNFDINVQNWSVNLNGVSYDTGVVIASGLNKNGFENIITGIDYTKLASEGSNRINIYGKSVDSGTWTIYNQV